MRFAIQVNSNPTRSPTGHSAYQFVKAALALDHEVVRVFFYHDGIYHAFKHNTPPDEEVNLTACWADLASQYRIDMVVCISAAQRRGLLHNDEAERRGKLDNDLAMGFRLGGLGQWVEALLAADRVIVFG